MQIRFGQFLGHWTPLFQGDDILTVSAVKPVSVCLFFTPGSLEMLICIFFPAVYLFFMHGFRKTKIFSCAPFWVPVAFILCRLNCILKLLPNFSYILVKTIYFSDGKKLQNFAMHSPCIIRLCCMLANLWKYIVHQFKFPYSLKADQGKGRKSKIILTWYLSVS